MTGETHDTSDALNRNETVLLKHRARPLDVNVTKAGRLIRAYRHVKATAVNVLSRYCMSLDIALFNI